jgi:hypothetical protein
MGLRIKKVALVAGLLAVGLFAAFPFLTDRMVGTGEAYNYSLSVADAVTQMRAGVFPPLAGQTPYAYNGRVHPLRNAPYLHYLAYALDVVSLRRLPLWRLQTASLALSLVCAVFACYVGLRWGTGCPRLPAFLLAAVYGLSPALLGAAYSFDLYMTVHVAVFVPLAIAACMRGCMKPSFSADAWLAAAVAAAWLAHPPVAIWLTAGVILVRLVAFLSAPSWSAAARAACATVLAAGLACFVFVSTASLGFHLSAFSGDEIWHGISVEIMKNLRSAFPACLLPVSRGASSVGDLQLGYVPWILLGSSAVGMFRAGWRRGAERAQMRAAAPASLAVAALLLALVIPVPGLTHLLWYRMPAGVLSVTSIWPFQRVYLVAVPFILFGAAMVLPRAFAGVRIPLLAGLLTVALGLGWTAYQAKAFISRGMDDRWTIEATRSAYRPSNLDLTITSYAFVQAPPTFVNGVDDPQFEYRLLRNGTDEIGSPFATALTGSPSVERGTIRLGTPSTITLNPGRRYFLVFSFRFPSLTGHIQISGPELWRIYSLPSSGSSKAFGMLDGERRAVSIWTDGDKPERVAINFFVLPSNGAGGASPALADYTLLEVDQARLPVRLQGYLPMRLSVDSPELGCTVETPQRYIPGYEATVNGKRVTVLVSPDMQVMVPVPRGHSDVEIEYRGPRSARAAFWVCAACWAGFLAWRIAGSRVPAQPFAGAAGAWGFVWRHRAAAAVLLACAIAVAAGARRHERLLAYRGAVGPIEVDFKLPYGKPGVNQPLLATGKPGAGVIIFVNCLDGSHVRLGADVWGQLFLSDPIEADFSAVQELVVSDSALYPVDHPSVRALGPGEIKWLRGELRVELNGHSAIRESCYSYETQPSDILAGTTRFGSLTIPNFLGEILSVERLPIPRQVALPWGRRVHMELTFPSGRAGTREPLLSATAFGATRAVYVTYLPDSRVRLSLWSSDAEASQSAELNLDLTRSHAIDFDFGETAATSRHLEMRVSLDGDAHLGSTADHLSYSPPLVVAGVNDPHVPGVEERFSGPRMDLSVVASNPMAGTADVSGAVHMVVSLPRDKLGQGEPLVTTGHAGAGDFVYVFYTDASHVQLGLDHWALALVKSDPIPADYGAPHEIWVQMNSLNPSGSSAASPPVAVIFDGTAALSSATAAFPSKPDEVTIARNAIGGSNANPEFSGTVDFVERVPPGSVPKPRS